MKPFEIFVDFVLFMAIAFGVALMMCNGFYFILGGVLWLGMLWVSAQVFPRAWRRFFAVFRLISWRIIRGARVNHSN